MEKHEIIEVETVQKIPRLAEIDPTSAIQKMRVILEKIVDFIYQNTAKKESGKKKLSDKLWKLNQDKVIPRKIYIYMNSIRITGNHASHGDKFTDEDIRINFPILCNVINWFLEGYLKNYLESKKETESAVNGHEPTEKESKISSNQEKIVSFRGSDLVLEEFKAIEELEEKFGVLFLNEDNFSQSYFDFRFSTYENHVVSITMRDLHLQEIPETINSFTEIVFLDFSHNEIVEIPSWINKFQNLKVLNLRKNRNLVLSKDIAKTIQKRNISVKHERGILAKTPSTGSITNQKLVYLAWFLVISIVISIIIEPELLLNLILLGFGLAIIKGLIIVLCAIGCSVIVFIFHKLSRDRSPEDSKSEVLKANEKRALISLKSKAGMAIPFRQELSSVIALNIRESNYTSIPEEIFQFKNLKYLYFESNKLFKITPKILQLENLEILNLMHYPNLNSISSELIKLKHLKEILIRKDMIKTLPNLQLFKSIGIKISTHAKSNVQFVLIFLTEISTYLWIGVYLVIRGANIEVLDGEPIFSWFVAIVCVNAAIYYFAVVRPQKKVYF